MQTTILGLTSSLAFPPACVSRSLVIGERQMHAEGPLVSHEGRGFDLADCQGGGSARCSVASERLQLKPSIWPPPRRSDPAFFFPSFREWSVVRSPCQKQT